MIRLCGDSGNSTPLFKGPRGYQKAFYQVPFDTTALYTDSDGERQSLMIQVVVDDVIGWTYWACGKTLL